MANPAKTSTPTPAGGGSPGGAPVHTIAGLARLSMPTTASEINYMLRSIDATCNSLALVIHQLAHETQGTLSWPPAGTSMMDRARLRRAARQVGKAIDQSADRVEAGGASARAAWRVYYRAFAEYIRPPRANRKTFDHRK